MFERWQIDEVHSWGKGPVELLEPVGAEPLDCGKNLGGLPQEIGNIDRLTRRREWLEVVRPSSQHMHRPVVIPPLDVVQAHPDLQDTLIETSHVTTLLAPQILQRLMLREELAAIELRNATQ